MYCTACDLANIMQAIQRIEQHASAGVEYFQPVQDEPSPEREQQEPAIDQGAQLDFSSLIRVKG